MNSLNIYKQQPTMKQATSVIDKIQKTIKNYLFVYPERQQIDLHLSIINAKGLFAIRVISFIYLTAIYLWVLSQMRSLFQNVEYLTLVGYFCSWLYFSLVLQDYYFNARKTLTQPKAHSLKLHIEVLYQMTLCVELPITIVFWTILFKIVLDTPGVTMDVIVLNGNLHAGPLVCLLLQFFFNKYSFPKRHLLPVAILQVLYLLVNLIYTLQVNPIYKPITWIDWQSYVLAIGAIVISVLLHFICRVVYRKWKVNQIVDQSLTTDLILLKQQEDAPKQKSENFNLKQNQTFKKSICL